MVMAVISPASPTHVLLLEGLKHAGMLSALEPSVVSETSPRMNFLSGYLDPESLDVSKRWFAKSQEGVWRDHQRAQRQASDRRDAIVAKWRKPDNQPPAWGIPFPFLSLYRFCANFTFATFQPYRGKDRNLSQGVPHFDLLQLQWKLG